MPASLLARSFIGRAYPELRAASSLCARPGTDTFSHARPFTPPWSTASHRPLPPTMAAPPAVPADKTARNLTGAYTLNHTLSDSSSEMLKMQNVGWLVRNAIAYSSIAVQLKQYDSPADGKPHLDQKQTSTGGMENAEQRTMDWQWREAENRIWGPVWSRGRYASVEQVADGFLREGYDGAELVELHVESRRDTWKARQTWGFAEVDGVRRQVRKIIAAKDDKELKVTMVYDWKGELKI